MRGLTRPHVGVWYIHNDAEDARKNPRSCLFTETFVFLENEYKKAQTLDMQMPCTITIVYDPLNKKVEITMAGIFEKLFKQSHDVGDIPSCAKKPVTETK